MSNELAEVLASIGTEADQIDRSIRDIHAELKNALGFVDDWDDLLKEVEFLKGKVVNLTNKNYNLKEQLNVLKKNLPEAERELMLWRLQGN